MITVAFEAPSMIRHLFVGSLCMLAFAGAGQARDLGEATTEETATGITLFGQQGVGQETPAAPGATAEAGAGGEESTSDGPASTHASSFGNMLTFQGQVSGDNVVVTCTSHARLRRIIAKVYCTFQFPPRNMTTVMRRNVPDPTGDYDFNITTPSIGQGRVPVYISILFADHSWHEMEITINR